MKTRAISWCATKPGDSDSHGRPRARRKSATSPSCAATARPPETPATARAERPVAIGSARLATGTCARATCRPTRARCDAGNSGSSIRPGGSAEIFKLWGDNRPPLANVQSKLLSYHALQNEATYPLDRVEVRLQDGNVLIRSLACVHAVALIPAHSLALAIHPLVRPASVR